MVNARKHPLGTLPFHGCGVGAATKESASVEHSKTVVVGFGSPPAPAPKVMEYGIVLFRYAPYSPGA